MRYAYFAMLILLMASCSKTINCQEPKLIAASLGIRDSAVYIQYRYNKGSNFTNPLDSVRKVLNRNYGGYYLYISDDYDWKIVPDSGAVIYLKDITIYPKTKKGDTYIGWTGKEKETGCFNDVSYNINGVSKHPTSSGTNGEQYLK